MIKNNTEINVLCAYKKNEDGNLFLFVFGHTTYMWVCDVLRFIWKQNVMMLSVSYWLNKVI